GARLVRIPERVPTELPEEEGAREDRDERDVPQETQPHPVSRGGAAGPHEVAMPDSVRGPFATRTPRWVAGRRAGDNSRRGRRGGGDNWRGGRRERGSGAPLVDRSGRLA